LDDKLDWSDEVAPFRSEVVIRQVEGLHRFGRFGALVLWCFG
jgi:hypothetical protein